jgi:hypothetical protein
MRCGKCCLAGGVALLAVAICAPAWCAVPRVTYNDPIAGFSLTIPDDWEMKEEDFGLHVVGIGAASGSQICIHQPVFWLFHSLEPPEKTARGLGNGLGLAWGVEPTVRATGNGDEWEVLITSQDGLGTLLQRYLCRSQNGESYTIAAFSRPAFAEEFRDDVRTAFNSCKVIPGPRVSIFKEPKYNAYRMDLPEGWKWEGDVIFARNVPGYFTWKVQSPDGLNGAFSSPPALFDITRPYMGVQECSEQIVLPGLRQLVPDIRLDSIRILQRTGELFCTVLREFGISNNPRIEKGLVDFVGTAGGIPVRVRVTTVCVQFGSSVLLGGRGDWTLFTAGVWGREDRFAQDYELGRGVMASLVTDQRFRISQMDAVTEVVVGKDILGANGKKRGEVWGSAKVRDWWAGRWVEEYVRR